MIGELLGHLPDVTLYVVPLEMRGSGKKKVAGNDLNLPFLGVLLFRPAKLLYVPTCFLSYSWPKLNQ